MINQKKISNVLSVFRFFPKCLELKKSMAKQAMKVKNFKSKHLGAGEILSFSSNEFSYCSSFFFIYLMKTMKESVTYHCRTAGNLRNV